MEVPSSHPFFVDPFGDSESIWVAYSMLGDLGPITATGETKTLSGALGATLDFAHGWRARVSGSYAEETLDWTAINLVDFDALDVALADSNPATTFNPFGGGSHNNPTTLDAIRDIQREHSIYDVTGATLITDGALFDMPGGVVKLAAGIDYREERLERDLTPRKNSARNVSAAFAELAIPLISAREDPRETPELELSLAARYEDYSDFGTTTNPKVGFTWSPHRSIALRGSWGTSFKAPKLVDLDESPATTGAGLAMYLDPLSPTGRSFVLVRTGNNAALKEETATIWTAGLDIKPWGDPAETISLTYFDIDYQDRILIGGRAGDQQSILLQEDQWSEIIQRSPSQGDVAAICNSPQFSSDPANCILTPPVAIIDFRLRNLGAVKVRGLDLGFDKSLAMAAGIVGLSLNGSYLFRYETAASKRSPSFDVVDTIGNPLALRLRGGISWERQGWTANAHVNYGGAYRDNSSRPGRTIDSWTTLDLRLSYRAGGDGMWADNTEVAVSATNLFDKQPPFVNSRNGYDAPNADLIGRVVSAQITKSW